MAPPAVIAKFGAPRGKGQAQVFLFSWRRNGPDGPETYEIAADGKDFLKKERPSDVAGWGADFALFTVPWALVGEDDLRADLVLFDGNDSGKQVLGRYQGRIAARPPGWQFEIDKREPVVDASRAPGDTPLFRWSPDGLTYETVALDRNRALPLGEQEKHKNISGFQITFELWLQDTDGSMVKAPKLPPVRAVLWGQEHPKLVALREAHRLLVTYRRMQVQWMQQNAQRAYLAQWVEGLGKSSSKIAGRINRKKLDRFQREFLATADDRELRKQSQRIRELLGDPELKKVLDAKGYLGACERALAVQGLGDCRDAQTQKWMERELEDEKDGILALIGKWDTKEGSAGLKDHWDPLSKSFEAIEPWLDATAEWVGTFTRVYRDNAPKQFATLLKARYGIADLDLLTKLPVTIERGMVKTTGEQVKQIQVVKTVQVLKQSPRFNPESIEKIKGGLEGLGNLIALMNFALAINVLARDPNLKNVLDSSGATLNLLAAFGKAEELKLAKAAARAGRDLEEATGLPKAAKLMAIGVEEEKGFGRILGKTLAENADALACITGVIDAITNGIDAKEAYGKGQMETYTAKSIGVIGGALIALGAGLSMSVAGAPLGAVLFVMGAIVQVVSAIFGVLGAESPLEAWVAHGEFGDRDGREEPDEGYEAWDGNPGLQIEKLKDLVFGAQILAKMSKEKLTVRVKPTMLNRMSRIDARITIGGERESDEPDPFNPVLYNGRVLDGYEGMKVKFRSGQADGTDLGDPVDEFSFEYDLPPALQRHNFPAAGVRLKIDPDGTGVPAYEFFTEIKPDETGVLAAVPLPFFSPMEQRRL